VAGGRSAHLVDESRGERLRDPRAQPLGERGAVQCQAEPANVERAIGEAVPGVLLRDRPGRQTQRLERAHRAHAVARRDARRGRGVERPELRAQVRVAAGLELGPQRRIGGGAGDEPSGERARVEASAADQKDRPTARVHVARSGPRRPGPAPRRHRLVRRDQVERVVRDLGAQRAARLGGADVEAPVHLHRVGAHDLGARAAGDLAGELGLAGARRPDDRDDPRLRRAHPRRRKRRSSSARSSAVAIGRPCGQFGNQISASRSAWSAATARASSRSPLRTAA
jgi:hypothetical protein